ncbi:RNA polymerase sigma factor [Virgibacillus byunsanensis]|uniref:RNA polymerase sigma factor n=1 Tax=Virgibacillus byunsanensis TaxID=570945 RepID=A0ABW3LRT7_9BACI
MDHEFIKRQVNDWYHLYNNDIYQYIFFMIGDHDQARDLMQDTFLRAYNNGDSFQGNNARGWLFRIARNITIDYIRKRKPISYILDTMPIMHSKETTPEQIAFLNETQRELYDAIGKMKRSYRDVIILRKIKSFSIQETATILGWNESKVKTTLFRGIKALKKELVKEGYQHGKV